jgi:hypothetical protein
MLFLQPSPGDFEWTQEILKVFGDASGLVTNVIKCLVTPIQCSKQEMS